MWSPQNVIMLTVYKCGICSSIAFSQKYNKISNCPPSRLKSMFIHVHWYFYIKLLIFLHIMLSFVFINSFHFWREYSNNQCVFIFQMGVKTIIRHLFILCSLGLAISGKKINYYMILVDKLINQLVMHGYAVSKW